MPKSLHYLACYRVNMFVHKSCIGIHLHKDIIITRLNVMCQIDLRVCII